MKQKYRVVLSTMAYMSQTLVVEADSESDAEDIVYDNELWNDGVWEYNGITSQTPEDEALEKVENGEVTLWVDDGAWNFIQLDEIDFVEVEK